MTFKKAREDIIKKGINLGACGYVEVEAVEIVAKALEKQTPKKPILKSGQSMVHINKGDEPHEMRVDKWQDWCCPVCGWFVGQRYNRPLGKPHDQRKSNYCNECGQRIDWSNE